MAKYYIIPGFQGSGHDHWQTWVQRQSADFVRIEQKNWNEPNIDEWAAQIENVLKHENLNDVILVAHSLGCHAVAQWAKRYNKTPRAALLVAPPSAENVREKINETIWVGNALQKLAFESLLVTSNNDPWIDVETAKVYAQKWGSSFLNIGNAGHINQLSGYGEWPLVLQLLAQLDKKTSIIARNIRSHSHYNAQRI
jgi:predicted alpha/beta hydrolase family esterase